VALLTDLMRLVAKLPPEGLALLGKLVKALLNSPDPLNAIKAATAAAAAKKYIRS